MNQKETTRTAEYDVPIPKPPEDLLERFLRTTEARFTTRRFPKDRDTKLNRVMRRKADA